jgi:hypothetical protein
MEEKDFSFKPILKSFPPDPSCRFGTEKANSNNECLASNFLIKANCSFVHLNGRNFFAFAPPPSGGRCQYAGIPA